MDLNDCDVVWSCRDPGGAEPAGDGSAADDTTYNFFPYNASYTGVSSLLAVPDLVSLICGSFSKPCPSDLH